MSFKDSFDLAYFWIFLGYIVSGVLLLLGFAVVYLISDFVLMEKDAGGLQGGMIILLFTLLFVCAFPWSGFVLGLLMLLSTFLISFGVQGPLSFISLVLAVLMGAGLALLFSYLKKRLSAIFWKIYALLHVSMAILLCIVVLVLR